MSVFPAHIPPNMPWTPVIQNYLNKSVSLTAVCFSFFFCSQLLSPYSKLFVEKKFFGRIIWWVKILFLKVLCIRKTCIMGIENINVFFSLQKFMGVTFFLSWRSPHKCSYIQQQQNKNLCFTTQKHIPSHIYYKLILCTFTYK